MSKFLSEEEEFELMYQEELEMEDENNIQSQPCCSKSLTQSTYRSPQLSQITCELSAPVNRRLFGTPVEPKRTASTPMTKSNSQDPLAEIQNIGITRKRRLEDLFGDIRDMENEMDFVCNEAKKRKGEERDLELIEKILEARRKAREVQNPLKVDAIEKLNKLHQFNKQNLSSVVPKWPFIAISHNGIDRIYVRKHSGDYEKKHIEDLNAFGKDYSGLLGRSQIEVWDEARELILKRVQTEQDNEVVSVNPVEVTRQDIATEQGLWVEKYKPRRYIELLSDETTNRSLLHWLKMWDKVVFGREFKISMANPQKLNTFNKRTGRFESTGGWNKRMKNVLNTGTDQYDRPIQKIALLCGPPGLGKTTLAHIIARHGGYSAREMNASDDRTPAAFRVHLESGTQMTSVLNEDKRPNCIIIDEIDGAPQQAIDFLIKFADDTADQKSKRGAKAKKEILKRPIICICNDLYVPALRQLRQIAFVVNFPPLESSRLADRLFEISRRENFRTDLGTLLALAEKSGNDVRSCLSMMQFFSAKKQALTIQEVLNSNIGQKDRHRGFFDVWTAVFQRHRKQLTNNEAASKKADTFPVTDMSISVRVKDILEVVHSGGDYERLMQGVFENYLEQKMPDPNFNGIVEATKWFSFSDGIQHLINERQDYTIYGYLQFGFVIWHLLFASLARPKIHFPNKGFEMHQKATTHKMILLAFRRGISAGIRGIGTGSTILLDTISQLKRILSPNLRSVSLQLLTPRERYDLSHTVEVMADLGLIFVQLKAIDGTYQYQLEPDIDIILHFPSYSNITLLYFGRQLIAREVELELMRRSTPKAIENSSKDALTKKKTPKKNQTGHTSPKNLPNHLQILKPKIRCGVNVKEMMSKDFFGRITTVETTLSVQEGGTDVIVKSPIWYKYKEGFNNAVRKDILVSDLL